MALVLDGNGTIGGVSAVRSDAANIPAQAQDVNGVGFSCRAWVNFDGTRDSTGAASTANTARFIRASGNVSSVVRNGTGDYTVNFANALPDANYSPVVSIYAMGSTNTSVNVFGQAALANGRVAPATSGFRFAIYAGANNIDSSDLLVAVFR